MTIDRDLWQRARPLFDEIVDLDADARHARLEAIGRSEPAMRDTLERLLQADGVADEALRGYDFAAGPPGAALPPVDLDPLGIVGRTVSHFDVTEFVAAGGMGVVYKAADATLGRVVAIKFPLPHQRMDDEAKERFIHEARSVAALDHPNLCTVYEFGESAHGLYLAMPFYQGETLKDRIARDRALPARDAVGITRQVAAGLASAHAAGIVHRDLKPGNVMILPDGSVKILDFGIAKVRDVQLTRSGVALGTIAYMAPSQAAGERADAQADLWAIGVMLYEMLTGVLPFRGPNEMAVLHAILHHDPEPPSRINKDVPPSLDAVVAGLLQKDASRRYRSAAALLSDLDAAMTGAPAAHKPPVVKRSRGRAAWRVAISAAAALVLVAGVWFGRQLLRHESMQGAPSSSGVDRSVAVLLVDRDGNNDATAYLAWALAEDVINFLGRASGVKVAAQAAAGTLQRKGLGERDIATQLGVKHLVNGTVRIASDTFFLAVHLTRVSDSSVVWKSDFKAPLARLSTLGREVADSLLHALQSGDRVASSEPLPTTDPVAYELYRKARFAWRERTKEGLDVALENYQEAVTRDPHFAAAYAGMADAYVNMSNFGWGSISKREALARAERAVHKAISLDSLLAEAHAALGFVQMSRGRYPEAEASLRRSIQLNPNWLWAHHYYALLLSMVGRPADARAQAEIALAIDPLALPAMGHLGAISVSEGKLEQARGELQKALEVNPKFVVALYYLGAIDATSGDYTAAEKPLSQAFTQSPAFPGVRGALAYTYEKLHRPADAERLMADARTHLSDERSRVNYALSLAIVGQADSAFRMLSTAEWDVPTLIELRSDPLLSRFRSDPGYPGLVAPAVLKR